MALDREIRAELDRDPGIDERGEPIPKSVARPIGIARAAAARLGDRVEGLLSPEAIVLIAEAAVHNGEWDDALEAATTFFSRAPAKNQFYCRTLFVQAQCEAHRVRRLGLSGLPAVRQSQKAIAYVNYMQHRPPR